jgi:hypothetical protein
MGEILSDGIVQGYYRTCPKCEKTILVDKMGNELGHHQCLSICVLCGAPALSGNELCLKCHKEMLDEQVGE